jgi:intein/homing endonuclease
MDILVEDNEKLAEFVGILTGDGFISNSSNSSKIGIVCDATKDREYVSEYVSKLWFELFKVPFRLFYRSDNTIRVYKYSNEVANFLSVLGFPIGKKGNLPMLDFVKSSPKLWAHFIRGFFDTDGCIFWDKRKIYSKPYPRIYLVTISKRLAEDISYCLKELGFNVFSQTRKRNELVSRQYSIELYGYKNLKRWLDLIGSSNKTKRDKLKLCLSGSVVER